jgi:hypothetical protein
VAPGEKKLGPLARKGAQFEARKIERLVELILSDNPKISQKIIAKVRRGEAVFPEYLD